MPSHASVRRRPVAALVLLAALTAVPSARAGGGDGFAGSSGEAGMEVPGPATAVARASTLPGIDVSHWQGSIDWARVAGAGKTFTFLKATDDRDYVDPTYATNRARAKANGLLVGAYHFARPDGSRRDAVKEARHFVRRAAPVAGELLPVLDIEVNDGLTPAQMTRWALRWVAVVRKKTGVHPLVYTSPYGWLTRFDDTKALARWGAPLWVAHWGVSSPTVPADDWAGRGWIVWQHSSSGRVSGISGDVDLDRFAGTDLAAITIQRLRVTVDQPVGVVTSSPNGIACRTACERNFDPGSSVTLTATPDDGAVFTGWGAACSGTQPTCVVTMTEHRNVTASFTTDPVPPTATVTTPAAHSDPILVVFDEPVRGVDASSVIVRPVGGPSVDAALTCRAGDGAVVACGDTVRSVELRPGEPLTPGAEHRVVVSADATIRDRVGNQMATTTTDFTAALAVEQGDPPARASWRVVRHRDAHGGTYAVERLEGASFAFDFRGDEVTWYTAMGRAFGKAEVLIDGRSKGGFDLYTSERRLRVARTFRGLGAGPHTIEVRVRGRARAAATDRLVAVDAFGSRDGVVKSPTAGATWREVASAQASGGTYATAELEGASVGLRFRGTGVDLTTATGPDGGRAKVFVDGELLRTVDLYDETRTFGVVVHVTDLDRDAHTVRIVATGDARRASRGTSVVVDRFDVLP